MTFLLMKSKDLAGVKAALPDFRNITHIFLPINDNRNVNQAEGGSHWSLLLVSLIDGVAFHYDSLEGANNAEAWEASKRLSTVVGKPLRFHHLSECPQQENGSDCGVFVCIIMRHLLIKRLLAVNAGEKISMSMAHKAIDSIGARKEMLKIIESFRKEGERRRLTPSSTPPRIE
jgi:sentrin-specific protease 8